MAAARHAGMHQIGSIAMSTEIERKFLVQGNAWRTLGKPERLVQGYLGTSIERVVRVRTTPDAAFLTIKGITRGISRPEYEYPIPLNDANEMLSLLCLKPLIVKTRYTIPYAGSVWQVDDYHAPREGLVIAEIELANVDEKFEIPPWIGAEVSGDPAYYNHTMITDYRG